MSIHLIYFQILVSFAGLIGTTTGFVFNTKCVAPPPCTCFSINKINCNNKQLAQVPAFTRHNEHYPKIELYLSYNDLTTIPAYAFANLSTVHASTIYLGLQYNRISSIETHAFSGIEDAVTEIRLDYNNLTHLPLALTELSSLHYLNLWRNPIVNLDVSVMTNIGRSLKILYISVDRFSNFTNELQSLTTLSVLRINGITFPMLDPTMFQGFKNSLTSLELSYANFENIPAAVCGLNNLISFTSDHSPNLGKYNGSIFDNCNRTMTNITTISLKFDKMTTIPKLAHIFPRLQTLSLNGNALHFIENNTLAGLNSLTYLDLGHNDLTHIPYAVNMAVSLHRLYLNDNQLATVEDFDLSRLPNLATLSLLDNPIVTLSPIAFSHNHLLDNIDLRSTQLGHVPRALLGLSNLRNVFLSGKPIECSCHDMHYLKTWNVARISIDAMCSSGTSVSKYLNSDLPKCP